MKTEAGSVFGNVLLEKILNRGISRDELQTLLESAWKHSGEVVAGTVWDGGRELCPRFPFSWPPSYTFGGAVERARKLRRPVVICRRGR